MIEIPLCKKTLAPFPVSHDWKQQPGPIQLSDGFGAFPKKKP